VNHVAVCLPPFPSLPFAYLATYIDMTSAPAPLPYHSSPLLLSFDIGTRHLAYCALALAPGAGALTEAPTVKRWAVVDLLAVEGTPYTEAATHVCLKSWTAKQLRAWLDARGLSSVGKRSELQARITQRLLDTGVRKVAPNNPCLLATQLHAYLDSQPWMLQCDHVVLENQPCLTNPVMKSVQLILFSYFMYRGVWCEYARRRATGEDVRALPKVSLVSASNKLKAEMTGLVGAGAGAGAGAVHAAGGGGDGDRDSGGEAVAAVAAAAAVAPAQGSKAAYKARKHDAIALMGSLLDAWCAADAGAYEAWRALFRSRCKKEQDDLSDCLLQGLYVLRKPRVEARAKATKRAIAVAKRAGKAAQTRATKAQRSAAKAAAAHK